MYALGGWGIAPDTSPPPAAPVPRPRLAHSCPAAIPRVAALRRVWLPDPHQIQLHGFLRRWRARVVLSRDLRARDRESHSMTRAPQVEPTLTRESISVWTQVTVLVPRSARCLGRTTVAVGSSSLARADTASSSGASGTRNVGGSSTTRTLTRTPGPAPGSRGMSVGSSRPSPIFLPNAKSRRLPDVGAWSAWLAGRNSATGSQFGYHGATGERVGG